MTDKATWLSERQAEKYLDCSKDFLISLRQRGLPFYKPGGKIYFKKDEIDSFIQKNKQQ